MVQSDHTPKMGNFLFVARTHTLDIRQSKSTPITTTKNNNRKANKTNFIEIPSEMHGICLNLWIFQKNVTIKNLQSRSTQTN